MTPVFARHETFSPRYAWLKKAYDAVGDDDFNFNDESAQVSLGVGKNMVGAMRYWAWAFQVLQKSGDGRQYLRTAFAESIFAEKGYDPYLEHPSTLWWLHWHLLKSSEERATAWYFLFHKFRRPIFSADELVAELIDYRSREYPMAKSAESSIIKDVRCILRMYVEHKDKKVTIEDSVDSPFGNLNLIRTTGERDHFAFNFGEKHSLSAEIIVASCLDFAATYSASSRTVALSTLLYADGSPGNAFKLNEASLTGAIEEVSRMPAGKHIRLAESGGLIQLTFDQKPETLVRKLLQEVYA